MRGLANVRAEFSLTALAYNLRRALNILGVEVLTAAAATETVRPIRARDGAHGRPLRSHQMTNAAKAPKFLPARSFS
jgi:hypothetical protein